MYIRGFCDFDAARGLNKIRITNSSGIWILFPFATLPRSLFPPPLPKDHSNYISTSQIA
jgi:hypothetical protein